MNRHRHDAARSDVALAATHPGRPAGLPLFAFRFPAPQS